MKSMKRQKKKKKMTPEDSPPGLSATGDYQREITNSSTKNEGARQKRNNAQL